jgi:Domain of unknown function (DUF4160)
MPALKLIEDDIDVPVPVPPAGTLASVASGMAVLVSSSFLRDIADGRVARADLDPVLDALDEEQEITAGMAAFRKKTTGVDNTIFISAKVQRHKPRIKVAIDPPTHLDRFGDNASVAIADGSVLAGKLPSHVHKQVREFLDLNRDVLIEYWEQRIDDDDLRQRLKPLPTR